MVAPVLLVVGVWAGVSGNHTLVQTLVWPSLAVACLGIGLGFHRRREGQTEKAQ